MCFPAERALCALTSSSCPWGQRARWVRGMGQVVRTRRNFCGRRLVGHSLGYLTWLLLCSLRAGVVTAVAIQCAPRPASVQSVFLACASFEAVLKVGGFPPYTASATAMRERLTHRCSFCTDTALADADHPTTTAGHADAAAFPVFAPMSASAPTSALTVGDR